MEKGWDGVSCERREGGKGRRAGKTRRLGVLLQLDG